MLWWLAGTGVAAPLDPLGYAPILDLLDPAAPIQVDTDAPSIQVDGVSHPGVLAGDVAVFAFGQVVLDQDVLVSGDRPLAILSHTTLVLDALVDVSATGRNGGPGGHDGASNYWGASGRGAGGGRINPGSGAGGGAFGGAGGAAEGGVPGGSPYGDLVGGVLEGGSGGGKSDDLICLLWCDENGSGGGGGGAVELGAVGSLTVGPSGMVLADGGNGSNDSIHGGGGGSGGGILLHGLGGRCDGALSARGGAGGDEGWGYTEGGGGSGGRIAMLGFEAFCVADVSPGSRPSGDAAMPGDVVHEGPPDSDRDGFHDGVDCDPLDPDIFPGAYDEPGDGVDQDCDGADGVQGTTTGPTTPPGTTTEPTEGSDTGEPDVPGDTGGGGPDDGPTDRDGSVQQQVGGGEVAVAGCGCGGASGGGWLALAVAAALGARRRQGL